MGSLDIGVPLEGKSRAAGSLLWLAECPNSRARILGADSEGKSIRSALGVIVAWCMCLIGIFRPCALGTQLLIPYNQQIKTYVTKERRHFRYSVAVRPLFSELSGVGTKIWGQTRRSFDRAPCPSTPWGRWRRADPRNRAVLYLCQTMPQPHGGNNGVTYSVINIHLFPILCTKLRSQARII